MSCFVEAGDASEGESSSVMFTEDSHLWGYGGVEKRNIRRERRRNERMAASSAAVEAMPLGIALA